MSNENTEKKTRVRRDVDLSKIAILGTGNMDKAEGFQPSVWDAFKDRFPNPGDFIEFKKDTEDGLTGAQAGQIAQRMRILHPGTYFHSGVITTKTPNTVFVRRREEGWLPTAEREKIKLAQASREEAGLDPVLLPDEEMPNSPEEEEEE